MTNTFRSFSKHPCLVKVNNFSTGVKVHNMGSAYAERWGHLDVIITTIEGSHYQGMAKDLGDKDRFILW